jgi:ubiquitin C-terminal hydrolase
MLDLQRHYEHDYDHDHESTTVNKNPPRGLINSGNMCFANSVLQIMVYCPPFHRLFAELGRVLGGSGPSGSGGLSVSSGMISSELRVW